MRRSTSLVLTLATLAGGGTTVWSLSTLTPARINTYDAEAAVLDQLRARPDMINSWTLVSRILLGQIDAPDNLFRSVLTQAAVGSAIDATVKRLGEEWAEPHGAEAMLWYTVSHQLALRAGRAQPDFTDPTATAARARAIDLLLEHSQKHPDGMKHWHWNSLAWAWLRSGKFSYAAGALERTETALLALPPETPSSVLTAGVTRLLSCWGAGGLGDAEQQAAASRRIEEALDRWTNASTGPMSLALADSLANVGAGEEAAAVLSRYADALESLPAENDLRVAWQRVIASAARTGSQDVTHRALLALTREIDQHGVAGVTINRNELGWRLLRVGDEDAARRVWAEWLDDQQRLVSDAPNPGNLYNLACALALVGRPDDALDTLEQSINVGWTDSGHMARDRDLESLHDSPRFADLLARLSERPIEP